jgi:hypothetical protein
MPEISSPHHPILFLSDAGNNIGLSLGHPTDLFLQVFLRTLYANKLIGQIIKNPI